MNPKERSDVELIQEVVQGSKESFAILYERYVEKIHQFIYYMVRNEHMAQDLTHDVFIRVFNNASKYKPNGKFSSWLYRIAKNHTLNHLKSAGQTKISVSLDKEMENTQALEKILLDESTKPDQVVLASETKDFITKGLLLLKPKERQILVMCDINEMPHEDVADVIGCKLNSLYVLLYRARKNLAKVLKVQGKYLTER